MAGEALATRIATERDVVALVDLINEAYLVEAFFVRGPRCGPDEIRTMLARGRFLVSPPEASAPIEGCVFIEPTPPRGYLGMLAVDPQSQHRGLGSRLLGVAERELARTCDAVVIRAVDTRPELFAYYGKRGYVRVGTERFSDPDRLKRPCQFILMEKTLRPPS